MHIIKLSTSEGVVEERAEKFRYCINGTEYEFAYHKLDSETCQVTDVRSGRRVAKFDRAAAKAAGCKRTAAVQAIYHLIEQYGPDRVQVVLDSAPSIEDVQPCAIAQIPELKHYEGSWIVTDTKTGEQVEIFRDDRKGIENLPASRYKIVTIGEHLAALNK